MLPVPLRIYKICNTEVGSLRICCIEVIFVNYRFHSLDIRYTEVELRLVSIMPLIAVCILRLALIHCVSCEGDAATWLRGRSGASRPTLASSFEACITAHNTVSLGARFMKNRHGGNEPFY